MRGFRLLLASIVLLFLTGCDESSQKTDDVSHSSTMCPECYMEVDATNKHSSKVDTKDKDYVFDDIGCMILFAQKIGIDFSVDSANVFTSDTKKFIPIYKARYKMHKKTPMNYGFVAYEKQDDAMIVFDEVRLKMLRGEHMANPKIRKKVLGI